MIQIDKNNSYLDEFSTDMIAYLNEKLEEVINNGEVPKPKGDTVVDKLSDIDIECLKYLKSNITNIITSDVKSQKKFIDTLKNKCSDITRNYPKKSQKPKIYLAVKYIFIDKGYEAKISSANDKKIAYKLVEKIGIQSCPYCNRNYISVLTKKEDGDSRTRPQLDHFYPKAIYPFLACSFYNLIPSCSACNLMKSDKDSFNEKLVSPYELDKDSFKFSYTLNNTDILNIGIQDSSKYDYKESINIIFDKKNETNEKYFELEKLYNQEHRDIVIELLVKKAYYPKSYIEELSKFGFGQDEIYRYLFSNYNQDEDLHKRPLSKLVRDISEELGLI